MSLSSVLLCSLWLLSMEINAETITCTKGQTCRCSSSSSHVGETCILEYVQIAHSENVMIFLPHNTRCKCSKSDAIHPIDVKNRHFIVVQEMPAKYDVLENQVVPREPRSKAAKPRVCVIWENVGILMICWVLMVCTVQMSRSDVMRLMRAKRTLTSSVALETVC